MSPNQRPDAGDRFDERGAALNSFPFPKLQSNVPLTRSRVFAAIGLNGLLCELAEVLLTGTLV
jgi:hypothetical protein